MKKTLMPLVVATLLAATTPMLAQSTAGQSGTAVMPGSVISKPVLDGGRPNPHEGHASVTCDKGPNAEVINAPRPECPNMGGTTPHDVPTDNGETTGAARNGTVGSSTAKPGN